jgi:opacity protein-like surface antigen
MRISPAQALRINNWGEPMKNLFLVLASTAALSAWQAGNAQTSNIAGGTGDWEVRIGPVWMDSKTVNFDGGTSMKLDSNTGFKLGTGYYVTDALIVGGNFAYSRGDFSGTVASGAPGGGGHIENGHSDYSTLMFDATYLFIPGSAFKPFVEGGLGWTWVNTNIAAGPPQTGCWWDPWWGYVCSGYQPTVSNSSFAFQAGLGVQANFSHSFAVTAAVKDTWIKLANSSGTPGFPTIELMFNWRIKGYY